MSDDQDKTPDSPAAESVDEVDMPDEADDGLSDSDSIDELATSVEEVDENSYHADGTSQSTTSGQSNSDREPDESFRVEPAPFPSLTSSNGPEAGKVTIKDLDFLADVDLEIAVELGRARMSLREVLGLAPGAVVELDKLAGEPATILINDKIIGRGEIVVIEDMFGIRVTEIIPPSQRWKYE